MKAGELNGASLDDEIIAEYPAEGNLLEIQLNMVKERR